MTTSKTTHEALEKLTPREAEVLRKRFGVVDKDKEITPTRPPGGDEDGGSGSGGVPAPADIPR